MSKKQKLELTWIGKDKRPRLEPRILLADKALSYRAAQAVTGNDLHDNLLIHGDNLLALKALEQQYARKVKCVFIDPPYNTGSAFTHYDDGAGAFAVVVADAGPAGSDSDTVGRGWFVMDYH